VVERLEGYIAQFLGDGLLIYFGYPRPTKTTPSAPCAAPWS